MRRMRAVLCALAACAVASFSRAAPDPAEDASAHVVFVQEFAGNCVSRSGVQILVRNTHPTRAIKIWLDRYHMGIGTGDRSRSELRPASEPEPLGCSRTTDGPQEWRLVRAIFVN
jgi:hypothetical protein